MIATTKEQSARLLQCGVPAESADMSWHGNTLETFPQLTYDMWLLAPAWSLSALLKILPSTFCDYEMTKCYDPSAEDKFEIRETNEPYQLDGDLHLSHWEDDRYDIDYDWDGFIGKMPQSSNPIEACVLAIELLFANGYKFDH